MLRKTMLWIMTLICFFVSLVLTLQSAEKSDELSKKVATAGSAVVSQYTQPEAGAFGSATPRVTITNKQMRDIAHIVMFLALAFFLTLLLLTYKLKRSYVLSAAVCIVYAFLSEVLQDAFTHGRSFQLSDIMRNVFGMAAGIIIVAMIKAVVLLIKRIKTKRRDGVQV